MTLTPERLATANRCKRCGLCAYCGTLPAGHPSCKARPGPGAIMWGPRKQHEAECRRGTP